MNITKADCIALIIWWCEGTKARRDYRWKDSYLYPIELTNTNPHIIKFFLYFLLFRMQVNKEKIKGQLQIHEGDNQQELENYWLKELGITRIQLNKTIVRRKGNKLNKSKGTFKLRFYDKMIHLKIQDMLNHLILDESTKIGM